MTTETAAAPAADLPPPEGRSGLAGHAWRYFNANLISIAVGLISFPIVARALSHEDYGILGYFELFPLIWVALLKMGAQQSIQRFYPIYAARGEAARRQFDTSCVWAPMAMSTVVCAAAVGMLAFALAVRPVPYGGYLLLVLVLGQMEAVRSLLDNAARARQRSALSARMAVAGRLLQLVLVVAVVVGISPTARGVFGAQLVAGALVLAGWLAWARRACPPARTAFDRSLLGQSLRFGWPLAVAEVAAILLAFADRLMIRHYLGDFAAVGIYAVGYAPAMYVGLLTRDSLLPAFQPIVNRLYETQGVQAAMAFERRVLRWVLHASAAFAVGVVWAGDAALAIAAGADKPAAGAGVVFRWVAVAYLLSAVFAVAAHGLTLLRRSRTITATTMVGVAVNVLLNAWWIPRFGLAGAAAATLAGYAAMGSLQWALCPPSHRPPLAAGDWVRPAAAAAAFAAVAWALGIGRIENAWARLAWTGGAFAAGYGVPALAIDASLRDDLRRWLARRRTLPPRRSSSGAS